MSIQLAKRPCHVFVIKKCEEKVIFAQTVWLIAVHDKAQKSHKQLEQTQVSDRNEIFACQIRRWGWLWPCGQISSDYKNRPRYVPHVWPAQVAVLQAADRNQHFTTGSQTWARKISKMRNIHKGFTVIPSPKKHTRTLTSSVLQGVGFDPRCCCSSVSDPRLGWAGEEMHWSGWWWTAGVDGSRGRRAQLCIHVGLVHVGLPPWGSTLRWGESGEAGVGLFSSNLCLLLWMGSYWRYDWWWCNLLAVCHHGDDSLRPGLNHPGVWGFT